MILTHIYKKFAAITALMLLKAFVVGMLPGSVFAQSAQTGTWLDASHIQYGGVVYIDINPTDDNLNYKEAGRQEDCVNTIREFSTGNVLDTSSTGQARIRLVEVNGISGECEALNGGDGEVITLEDSPKSKNLLAWVDSGRIQSVANGDLYIRVGTTNQFAIEGGDSCKSSYIEINGTTEAVIRYQHRLGDECREKEDDAKTVGIGDEDKATLAEGEGTLVGNQEGAAEAFQDSCESRAGAFGWITCPFLKILDSIVTFLDEKINELLYTPAELYEDEQIEAMWGSVRNIAYLLLIPAMLVIVIGTALGFTVLDPYTIKRSLPKLLVATIFIAISLPVLKLSIEVINAVGLGISGLITSVGNATGELSLAGLFDPDPVQSVAITGGAIGGTAIALSVWPIWLNVAVWVAIGVIITIFTVFFMLALRQLLILALVVFAPLAILAWIFPGTNKFWKLWWESFSKLLLLYPLIMAVLAVGRVFADVIQASNIDGIVAILLKLVAYIGPFFFIPSAFKYGGTALASMGNMVNRGVAPLQKQVKQQRNNAAKGNYERLQAGTLFKGAGADTKQGKKNAALQRLALAPKAIKSDGFRNLSAGIDKEVRNMKAHELDQFFKDPETGIWRSNDGVSGPLAAILNGDDKDLAAFFEREYLERSMGGARIKAKSEAEKVGVVGSDAYKARYKEVYDGEKAIFDSDNAKQERSVRAAAATTSVLDMQKKGDLNGALTTALSEGSGFRDDNDVLDTRKRDVAVSQAMTAQKKYGNTVLARGAVISAMEGGTYYQNAVDTWRAAGLTTHGDDNAEAEMVIKGRKALQGAGRAEGLGSFGSTLGHMQAASSGMSDDEITAQRKEFANHLIENNPPGTFANPALKDKFLESDILPAFQVRLDEAAESGDEGRLIREVAVVNGIYQQLATTKPKMAKLWAEEIMNKELPESGVEMEQVLKIPTKKIVPQFSGLYDDKNEPIMVDKEIIVEEEQRVKVKKPRRTTREAANDFKYTKEWASTNKEMYSPEEYEKMQQGQQARMLGSAEERMAAEEEARRFGAGGDGGLGGPPIGGPPIGGPPLTPKL